MDSLTFYRDADGGWRWRRMSLMNGEEVGAATEGYQNRQDAIANAARVSGVDIPEDLTPGTAVEVSADLVVGVAE